MIYFNLFLLTTAIASTSAVNTASFQQLLGMIPDKMDFMVLPNQPTHRFRDLLVSKAKDLSDKQEIARKDLIKLGYQYEKIKSDVKTFSFAHERAGANDAAESVSWKRIIAAEAEIKLRNDLMHAVIKGYKPNSGASGIDNILQNQTDTVNKMIAPCVNGGKKDLKSCLGGHYETLVKNAKIVLIGQQMFGEDVGGTAAYTLETDVKKLLNPTQLSDVRIYNYPSYFNYEVMKAGEGSGSIADVGIKMMEKLKGIKHKMESDSKTDPKLVKDVKLRIALVSHIFYDLEATKEKEKVTEELFTGRKNLFESFYVLAVAQHLLYDTSLTAEDKENLKDFLRMYLMKVQMIDSASDKNKIKISGFVIDMPNPNASTPAPANKETSTVPTATSTVTANPSVAKDVNVVKIAPNESGPAPRKRSETVDTVSSTLSGNVVPIAADSPRKKFLGIF